MRALRSLHDAMTGVKKLKNKRSTLFKQMRRVEDRMQALLSGAATVQEYAPRCRTCESASCSGRCWGFWADTEDPFKVEVTSARHMVLD